MQRVYICHFILDEAFKSALMAYMLKHLVVSGAAQHSINWYLVGGLHAQLVC